MLAYDVVVLISGYRFLASITVVVPSGETTAVLAEATRPASPSKRSKSCIVLSRDPKWTSIFRSCSMTRGSLSVGMITISITASRLSGRMFDMLFVNAGITNRDPNQTIAEISTEDFIEVMLTNALSPMRVMESLEPLVSAAGLIGAMSSGQGSVANNIVFAWIVTIPATAFIAALFYALTGLFG